MSFLKSKAFQRFRPSVHSFVLTLLEQKRKWLKTKVKEIIKSKGSVNQGGGGGLCSF